MRMTRAALRAQTGAEEFPEINHESVKQGIVHVHQDSESFSDFAATDSPSVRPVLRDITEENYPSDPFVDSQTENKKKSRKGRTKKPNSKVVVEQVERSSGEVITVGEPKQVQQIEIEEQDIEAKQSEVETEDKAQTLEEFAPEVIPEATTTADSLDKSVPPGSPAAFTSQSEEELVPVVSFADTLRASSPIHRTTSAKFEESFEAMDSLEDSIEQMTEGLPLLPAEEMPESPIKPIRSTPKSLASNTSAVITPRSLKSSSKLQNVLSWNKENAPPTLQPKTPTPTLKPLNSRTPTTQQKSALKPTTAASTRKPISVRPARSPIKTSATPAVAADHKTASARKSTVKRPVLIQTTNIKPGPVSKKPEHNRAKSHGVSLLESPSKSSVQTHKRRVTSAVLSTAKPGFVPTKSSKAPTTSTFMLPSEAIAEKLKAQKEAREERMKNQGTKMTLAEEKAAKLKSEREAREERVRQNQARDSREVSGTFTLSSEAVAEKLRAQKEAREERMRTQPSKMTMAEEKAARLKAEREAREERVRANQAGETREPSASTFTLSSEAVAEKLRAQKEAREERMKQQDGKAALAAEKAAKLKAERAAREERVKLNQKRAEEQLTKIRDDKQELSASKVRLDIQKARAEAAERGRQASREWAAKKKIQGQTVIA